MRWNFIESRFEFFFFYFVRCLILLPLALQNHLQLPRLISLTRRRDNFELIPLKRNEKVFKCSISHFDGNIKCADSETCDNACTETYVTLLSLWVALRFYAYWIDNWSVDNNKKTNHFAASTDTNECEWTIVPERRMENGSGCCWPAWNCKCIAASQFICLIS